MPQTDQSTSRTRRRQPRPDVGADARPDLEEPVVVGTSTTTTGDTLVRERTAELEDGRAVTRVRRVARGRQSRVLSENVVTLKPGEEIEDPVQHKYGCPMNAGRVEAYPQPTPEGGMTTVVRCVDCGESVSIDTNRDLE